MIEIHPIATEETYTIRKEELRKNVSLSHEMAGDEDPDTLHLGIFVNNDLAGIVSLMRATMPSLKDSLQYQIRGMATSSPYQGKGFGKKLLMEAEKRLKARGVEFLPPPPQTYYDDIPGRLGEHMEMMKEDLKELQKLSILVDADEEGYLLQIFTKTVEDRPTLFYEIIQRMGAKGFGAGNFKALFESIEREQAMRGTL